MGQKFRAELHTEHTHPNGAKGYGPGGPFDCIGTFAKVKHCPVYLGETDTGHRLTCYATGYADTAFSIPACTRYKGQHIGGYFTVDESKGGAVFRVLDRYADKLRALERGPWLVTAEHRPELREWFKTEDAAAEWIGKQTDAAEVLAGCYSLEDMREGQSLGSLGRDYTPPNYKPD